MLDAEQEILLLLYLQLFNYTSLQFSLIDFTVLSLCFFFLIFFFYFQTYLQTEKKKTWSHNLLEK